MELLPKPNYNSSKRYWRRRGYQKLNDAATSRKKKVRITRFRGSSSSRRFWKIKLVPKLRLKLNKYSPLQLWTKFKNAYVQMMINLAGKVGYLNDENAFGSQKRIPKAQQATPGAVYSIDEVENRLVLEIYKALVATHQLSAKHIE